jgi:hypothetical protein
MASGQQGSPLEVGDTGLCCSRINCWLRDTYLLPTYYLLAYQIKLHVEIFYKRDCGFLDACEVL